MIYAGRSILYRANIEYETKMQIFDGFFVIQMSLSLPPKKVLV